MSVQFEIGNKTRKDLVKALCEIWEDSYEFTFAPDYAYTVGPFYIYPDLVAEVCEMFNTDEEFENCYKKLKEQGFKTTILDY